MKQAVANKNKVVSAGPTPDSLVAGPACDLVFVVDNQGHPLMPTSPRRARVLLKKGRAKAFSYQPFTIRLLDRAQGDTQPLKVKIDPGSKTTGIVLVAQFAKRGWVCLAAWELSHRGQAIVNGLLARKALRQGRRSRKTRYRPARFLNRKRPAGWLPPSLRSRVDNVLSRCRKLLRVAPVSGVAVELVRFDIQQLENPEIAGVQYQQGTLAGYEVKEYLLLKWKHQCSYCQAEGVPLQIEHITPKSGGGSNRISNLCLACEPCNQKKANRSIDAFLKNKPELLRRILSQAKAPLKDAAAVNTTRWALVDSLRVLNLPLVTASGGLTKFNRTQQGYAKAHWIDAACVGDTGAQVDISRIRYVTLMQAKGRGTRQMCLSDRFGFPRTAPKTVKRLHGFQTGDRVRLSQPNGKYRGTHEGVVGIRATGMFDITTPTAKITASHVRFTLLARFDGYATTHRKARG